MNDTKEMSAKDENAHIHKAYVRLPTELLADVGKKTISGPAVVLYAFLLFWQGKKYDAFYGIRAMARETGFSEGKVKDLVKELVQAGHIRRTRKFGACWRTKCITVLQDGKLYIRGKRKRPSAEAELADRLKKFSDAVCNN